jgi:hypothetical protein
MTNSSYLAVGLCLCALGCANQASEAPLVEITQTPVALDSQLVFVDSSRKHAHLFDVSAAQPSATTLNVDLPSGAGYSERRVGHDEALLLCAGRPDSADAKAEPAALVTIDGAGKTRTYELGMAPFDTLKQSDDGRYAILFRSGKDQSRTLNNPNELVVVDLSKQPDDTGAVTHKTPDGLGHPLTQVIVSPALTILNEERRLLVLLSSAEVTLFDLTHLERRATIVQLDDTRQLNPVQVLFGTTTPTLYVRAQNSDNIFMFRFESHTPTELGNDFRPTINVLGAGSGPRDMALFGEGMDQRLLVVAVGSSQALVVDPSSSKTSALTLKAPAEHIALFNGPSPRDMQVRPRALLYAGDARNSVTFLDLNDLEKDPEDKVEMLTLDSAIAGVISLVDAHEMVFLHAKAITLLNLPKRTITLISSNSSLQGGIFDAARRRLWIGAANQAHVSTLDLDTGLPNEVLLDASIHGLVPMFAAKRVVVLHDSAIGYLTLLDSEKPTRDSALSVRGFFVSALFDRGAK